MKAYELIETPEKWTKGAFARDALGNSLNPEHSTARQWCVIGAIRRVYGHDFEFNMMQRLINRNEMFSVSEWNDAPERTHAEVIAALKEADI